MTYFTFVRLGLFSAAVSLLCFQPLITRAEDEQGTATTEDAESQPARETPNFFPPNQIQASTPGETPAPSTAPVPVAGEDRQTSDREFGMGVFSKLPFHLLATLRAGYDDNVLTTRVPGNESSFVNPNAQIDYKFADPRTSVTLTANAGITYYFDRSVFPTLPPPPFGTPTPTPSAQDYDLNLSLGVAVTHKASARLKIGVSANLSYQTEPDFSVNVGTNRRTGNYFYNSDRLVVAYQWLPRFATNTNYSLGILRYEDSAFASFLDRSDHTLSNEFRFLLWPMTTLIAEGRVLFVTYDQGSSLDSTTEIILGGIEHKISERFLVSLRGGTQFRSFENGIDKSEPYFESVLNYIAGRRTTVNWFTRYSLEEPGVAGSQTVTTFRTGLQTKYGLAPRIFSTVGLYYVRDDYPEGPRPPRIFPFIPRFPKVPAIAEETIDVNLGLRYEINRTFGIDLGYAHTEVTSNQSFRDYSRNRFFGGLSFTF